MSPRCVPGRQDVHIEGQDKHDLYNLSYDKQLLRGDSQVASPVTPTWAGVAQVLFLPQSSRSQCIFFGQSSPLPLCCLGRLKRPRWLVGEKGFFNARHLNSLHTSCFMTSRLPRSTQTGNTLGGIAPLCRSSEADAAERFGGWFEQLLTGFLHQMVLCRPSRSLTVSQPWHRLTPLRYASKEASYSLPSSLEFLGRKTRFAGALCCTHSSPLPMLSRLRSPLLTQQYHQKIKRKCSWKPLLSGKVLSLWKYLLGTERTRYQHPAGWCPSCPSALWLRHSNGVTLTL